MEINLYKKYFDEKLYYESYKSSTEHMEDLLCLLDIYLSIAFLIKEDKGDGIEKLSLRGITITSEEVKNSLEASTVYNRTLILSNELKYEIIKSIEHIKSRVSASERLNIALKFNEICNFFNLSDFQRFSLLTSIASEYNRKYEKLFGYIQDDINLKVPTKGMIISLYELANEIDEKECADFLNNNNVMFRYLFQSTTNNQVNSSNLSDAIYLKKRVLSYILGLNDIDFNLKEIIEFFSYNSYCQELVVHSNILEKIINIVNNLDVKESGSSVIYLFGKKGIGKKFIVKHLARIIKTNILFINVSGILLLKKDELREKLNDIFLEMILSASIVCFTNLDDTSYEKNNLIEFINYVKENVKFFFMISEEKIKEYGSLDINKISIEIPILTAREKAIIWSEFIKEYKVSTDVDIALNANKYILTPKQIKDVLNTARFYSYSENDEIINQKHIISAIKQGNLNQLGEYATLVNAVFTWEDLIIEDKQKSDLQLICDQLKYRDIVGNQWGFDKKMPYGKGLCSLFYGSPGTGKTMAAQVIANELGLDLYRIDLSQLVSKYIGETEKNISMLFKNAQNINAILFFDEADSLFAKRSEVKSSNDKYANSETAHLLQKIEDYEGISILATNFSNNIDDAFKRRIRFMIEFKLPNAETRYKLWKSILPKEAKADPHIDFDFFAKEFELSPSTIKEILLNSAYIAAAENVEISNRTIFKAIKNNFSKYNKVLSKANMGIYFDILD